MNREEFQVYVDHFNNREYDGVTGYFAPDITVEYYDNATGPQIPHRTLRGPAEFEKAYKTLHASVREVLEIRSFLSTETELFVELYTEFHAFKDAEPSASRPPMKKGDITIMTNFILYEMDGNVMKRIRIAHFRNHPPEEAKYKE